MVKPPKTMQPEAVDLSKAGRGSGKAFHDDTFRNHMARKIDLQRRQFGLVVPPDPTVIHESTQPHQSLMDEDETLQKPSKNPSNSAGPMSGRGFQDDDFRNYMARKIDMQRKQFGLVLPPDPRLIENESIQQPVVDNEPRKYKVRFADDVKEGANDTTMNKNKDGSDMASVLNRLKRKHGKRIARLRRKRQRMESERSSPETSASCFDADTEVKDSTNDAVEQDSKLLKELTVETKPQPLTSPRSRRPDLFFFGVVVLVNGYTNPDVETLQRLLQKHGGDLEKYETTRVTHIIAEHLSTAKAKIYKQRKRPIPVCYPTWITDSVEAGRLIPPANYLIQEVKDENVGAKNVSSFFWTSAKTKNISREQPFETFNPSMVEESDQSEAAFVVNKGILDRSVKLREGNSTNEKIHDGHNILTTIESNGSPDERQSGLPSTGSMHLLQSSSRTDSNDSSSRNEGIIENRKACISRNESPYDNGLIQAEEVTEEILSQEILNEDKNHLASTAPTLDTMPSQQTSTLEDEHDYHSETCSHGVAASVTNAKYINGRIRTVGTDPHFLESFFNSSRLSFIGSYKQRIPKPTAKQERGNTSKKDHRLVFHVDMDSFFASVVLRHYPEYRNKPVAISHHGLRAHDVDKQNIVSKNSTSECATCNYEARKYGITKGMYLGRAKELCPELIVLYYDFEGYEEVSDQVTEILQRRALQYNGSVEQVSCDESYVEMFIPPDSVKLAGEIANELREEIFAETQCTASIGVGPNKLLAKLATDKVKPNGSFVVQDQRELLRTLQLRDLHGVGYRMERKLSAEGLVCVSDVWDLGDRAEGALCRILGAGLGKRILQFCKGEDDRPVKPAERKTIGAECNYGVRFDGPYGVDHMIAELAKEVERRMQAVGVRGCRVTMKLKQRKQGAKPPPKFLGHGSCHNHSKSLDTPSNTPTRDWAVLSRIGNALFNEMKVPTDDVRGMGIVVSKLVFDDKQAGDVPREQGLFKWFEGSPCISRGNANENSTIQEVDHDMTINEDQNPRRLSVSFAPTTLLRSIEKDKVIEMEQDLSPPAACFARHSRRAETSSPPVASDVWESSVYSPLACRENDSSLSRYAQRPAEENENAHCSVEGKSNAVDSQSQINESESGSDGMDDRSQDCIDVALPALSQIRMSQVELLPSPLQRTIKHKIEIARTAVSYTDSNHEASRPTTDDPSQSRLRQVSVKRMLRLAAVKSKVETLPERLGDSVSLTQLESLPFEMQLQIANDDDLEVGVLASVRNHRPKGKCTGTSNLPGAEHKPHAGSPDPVDYEIVVIDDQDDWVPVELDDVVTEDETGGCDAESNFDDFNDSSSFFRDNIAPLHVFLDQNPEAEDEAVKCVVEFLCLCVSEHRPRDAVMLLRSIKNRGDVAWGRAAYRTVLDAVNERCSRVLGVPLDVDWLGLAPPTTT